MVEQLGFPSAWGRRGGEFDDPRVVVVVVGGGMRRFARTGGDEGVEGGTVEDGRVGGVELVVEGLEDLKGAVGTKLYM